MKKALILILAILFTSQTYGSRLQLKFGTIVTEEEAFKIALKHANKKAPECLGSGLAIAIDTALAENKISITDLSQIHKRIIHGRDMDEEDLYHLEGIIARLNKAIKKHRKNERARQRRPEEETNTQITTLCCKKSNCLERWFTVSKTSSCPNCRASNTEYEQDDDKDANDCCPICQADFKTPSSQSKKKRKNSSGKIVIDRRIKGKYE